MIRRLSPDIAWVEANIEHARIGRLSQRRMVKCAGAKNRRDESPIVIVALERVQGLEDLIRSRRQGRNMHRSILRGCYRTHLDNASLRMPYLQILIRCSLRFT